MSRTIIWGIVAAVIAALTAAAYFVTGASLDEAARKQTRDQVVRAQNLLTQTARLEALGLQKDAERLSIDTGVLRAATSESTGEAQAQANLAFQRFNASSTDATKPDIMAVVGPTGDIAAMNVTGVPPKDWKEKDDKGNEVIKWPAVDLAISRKIVISEIWDYPGKGLMRVGIASVVDPSATPPTGDDDGVVVVGAVVLAYSLTAAQATELERNLGTDVAFFSNGRVDATSLGPTGTADAQRVLGALLPPKSEKSPKGMNLADPRAGVVNVTIAGNDYLAASARAPRSASRPLPGDYPPATSGAIVLMTPDPGVAGSVRTFILLVGVGSLVVALLGLYLANRRMLAQVDQIEVGVADIINGNVDRTFRPVGQELDGLANGLNVMLARLLGRPEPGEEELDDDGNPIVQGRVEFEDQAEAAPGTDPELARLAQEPEPDYYKRVYTDYKNARASVGQPDEVSFENFIAKLKVNEGKLRAQYQSRAVRFRVVTKDGKVTLKPVPIL
jgi:hypothetical protein